MWRWGIILLVLLLQGCSMITVDEAQPVEEEYVKTEEEKGQDQEIVEQNKVEVKELSLEEDHQKSFRELLGSFFGLDWADSKSVNATPIQYMALGDSLTRGIGDEKMDYGYTERLVAAMEAWPEIKEVTLDNRGKNGRRSDQLVALLERGHYDDELPKADLITLTLGGNDVMRVVRSDLFSLNKAMFDAELPGFQARYAQIVQEIRARNGVAPLILIGFYNPFHIVTDAYTPFETIIDEWNASIEEIAQQDVNACFVPIADLFVSNDNLVYHTDFFHPNASGYDKMATRIIETMQSCNIEEMSAGRIGFEE